MDFGIMFANTGLAAEPDHAAAFAQLAEELGYESVWTVEHVVVPLDYTSPYPYSQDGRMHDAPDTPAADPLVWLTWAAAATTRLRLGTGILVLPLRNPLVLAKQVASLDVMSKGRMTLGVGSGWLREEFDAVGVPFEGRGARMDEYIQAMRVLWNDAESTFHGEHVDFARVLSYPKPAQAGGVPIAVGGDSDAAARRAGRFGDEYFPGAVGRRLVHQLEVMRQAAAEAGRDPSTIRVTAGGIRDLDDVKRLADLGVSRVVTHRVGADPDAWATALRRFSEEIVALA